MSDDRLNSKTVETFLDRLDFFEMIVHNMIAKSMNIDGYVVTSSLDEFWKEIKTRINPDVTKERAEELLNEAINSYFAKRLIIYPYNDS